MRYKNPLQRKVTSAGQLVAHIFCQNFLHVTAIFFCNTHLATASHIHLDARLQPKQVGAKGGHTAAAPARSHKLQRVQNKGRAHLFPYLCEVFLNFCGRHTLAYHHARLHHKVAASGGKASRIYRIHAAQLICRQHAILVGRRQPAAQIDMHNFVALTHCWKNAMYSVGVTAAVLGKIPFSRQAA